MPHRSRLFVGVLLLAWPALGQDGGSGVGAGKVGVAKPAEGVELAALMPADAFAYAELDRPAEVWQKIVGAGLVAKARELRSVRDASNGAAGLRIAAALGAVRAVLGMEPEAAFAKAAGGGVAIAAVPAAKGDGKPAHVLLVIRAVDPPLLTKIRDAVAEMMGLSALGEWLPEAARVTRRAVPKVGDVELVSIGKQFHHAIVGDCFIASDALPVLDAAVARIGAIAAGARGESLASRPGYVAARKLASSGSLGFPFGFAWADVDAIAAARPEIRSAETTMEPGQALLVGGARQAVVLSPWLSLALSASPSAAPSESGGAFLLRFQTAAKPQLSAPVFLPAAAAVPELAVPRRLGSLVLRRDVEAFWRDHEGIVAAEFDAEFAKLNSTIAAIFGVRRMDEDVLLHLAPVSQFVSARQTYSGLAANPKIAIPAFAMILQEKKPNKKVTDGFRRAFQTAVALGSAERVQKEKMALGLSEETLGDVKITFATFPDPEGSGPVDAEYNYSPAFFAKGPYVVFSTTLELARDLVKSLDAPAAIGAASPGEPSGAGPALDSLELWGEETCRALEENFDAIVAQNMLEKGQTRAEARTELRGLIDLVSLVSRLRAETRERGPGLELSVRIETAGAAGKASPASEPAASRPRQAVR